MKYVHRKAGQGFGYTQTYCWHLGVARKWKTRRGVERWLEKHPEFRNDFFVREITEQGPT